MANASWRELQTKFMELLGTNSVYYQPPTSQKLKYDCIVFSKKEIRVKRANDSVYSKDNYYEGIVIARDPDPEILDKLIMLPYCNLDRFYIADNLYHYPFTIFY